MSQIVVAEQDAFTEGQIVDLGNTDIVSFLAEGGAIPFGRFLELGTDKEKQAKIVSAATGITDPKKIAGFAVRQHTIENPLVGNVGEYLDEASMSVMKKGRIAVICVDAFTQDSVVHIGFQNSEEGLVFGSNSIDRDILANARFLNSGGAGAFAILDLSLV